MAALTLLIRLLGASAGRDCEDGITGNKSSYAGRLRAVASFLRTITLHERQRLARYSNIAFFTESLLMLQL